MVNWGNNVSATFSFNPHTLFNLTLKSSKTHLSIGLLNFLLGGISVNTQNIVQRSPLMSAANNSSKGLL